MIEPHSTYMSYVSAELYWQMCSLLQICIIASQAGMVR